MNATYLDASLLVWVMIVATVMITLGYEALQYWRHRDQPDHLARSAHAGLRQAWFEAMSAQHGSEIIAVQTLRNSLMSSTLTASTAALGLMGTVTLAASSLAGPLIRHADGEMAASPRLVLELLLMTTLFTSLACSTTAVRYFNHASFIVSMPIDSRERRRWGDTGIHYLRQGGILYGWGFRALLMVAPLVASILNPIAGPFAAMGLVVVLWHLDQVNPNEPDHVHVVKS